MSKLFENASTARHNPSLNMPKNSRRRKNKQKKEVRTQRATVTPHWILQAYINAT